MTEDGARPASKGTVSDAHRAPREAWPDNLRLLLISGVIVAHAANSQRPWAVRASRGSYAAFLIHPIVLVLLSLGVHALPWPPELKFLLVAAAGVPLTFVVGKGLTRLPGVNRVV